MPKRGPSAQLSGKEAGVTFASRRAGASTANIAAPASGGDFGRRASLHVSCARDGANGWQSEFKAAMASYFT